ncbi:MAG: alpha/beta hydrolase [Bryobacteraceae bacterium]|nr:alpha/beta hydrolase [Bryobacteraceae bacterium]
MRLLLILSALSTALLHAQAAGDEKNVAYDSFAETKLDVLMPKSGGGAKRPAVIFIHGGGWVGGAKENVVQNFCARYLDKGFVVFNVEYRLAKVALAPAAVTDVLKAAEWVRRNANKYGVDDRKIVVSGDSAGGHLSLMVGMTPKNAGIGPSGRVGAVVNFYGITDVLDVLEGPNRQNYAVGWIPDATTDRREAARKVSPMTYVRKGLPPIFTIHGSADTVVPYDHGIMLTKALRDEKNDAEMMSITNGGHGDFLKDPKQGEAVWAAIWEFLAKRKLMP